MKVMVFANLLVGDSGVLSMSPQTLDAWQRDKVAALAGALDDARSRGAEACLIAGGLLAEGFVPQSLLEGVMGAFGASQLQLIWIPLAHEASDLEFRVRVPDNLRLIRECSACPFEGIRVIHEGPDVEVRLSTDKGSSGGAMASLEPSGFGEQARAGYLLLDVEGGLVTSVEEVPRARHAFLTRRLDLTGGGEPGELKAALRSAIEGIDPSACLRLVLTGALPLSTYVNVSNLLGLLQQRFFYAEVADECSIDLPDDELEGDVSLMAEFARMVKADDTLSPVEKTRVLRCGWNALNGKELAE